MRADLSDSIKIRSADLPEEVRVAIQQQLTIPNPQKALAKREHLWGADRMDDHLRLYSYDADGYMILPMGFKHALSAGLESYGIPLVLFDWRSQGEPLPFATSVVLRGYQDPMCSALLEGQCGIVEAPTAAGKTAVVLAAIQRTGRNAIITVDKASLAKQWIKAVNEFLRVDCGYIGEREWRVAPVTVALRQALHARTEELYLHESRFFDRWRTLVVDEAHHAATAWSLIELVQRFTSFNRWGATATPERDPDYFPILQSVIGPVLWRTTMADAGDHLVIPSVRVLDTDFEFEFKPTKRYEDPETGKMKTDRNNYTEMMAALCEDPVRNFQIAQAAHAEADAGHHVLIVSQRKKHLEAICDQIPSNGENTIDVYMITSRESGDAAMRTAGHIEQATNGTITFSTVADEGLNIKRLDRVIPAYPRRNVETMRQIVGRIMRPAPGKTDAIIIDLRDSKQFLLRSQFHDRAQRLYAKEGWSVERQ